MNLSNADKYQTDFWKDELLCYYRSLWFYNLSTTSWCQQNKVPEQNDSPPKGTFHRMQKPFGPTKWFATFPDTELAGGVGKQRILDEKGCQMDMFLTNHSLETQQIPVCFVEVDIQRSMNVSTKCCKHQCSWQFCREGRLAKASKYQQKHCK